MKYLFLTGFLFFISHSYSQRGIFANYQDTNRTGLSFNAGITYKYEFNNYDHPDPYSHGAHWSIRFRRKFFKSTNLVNGSVGLQFSANNYQIQEKLVVHKDSSNLYYEANPHNGAVWVRARSLSVPLLISLRPRNVEFLKRFKLETGFMFGGNFSRIKQFLYDSEAETDRILPPRAAMKEVFKINLPNAKVSFLSVLSFDNFSIFYEHCFPTKNGTHFNVGRKTVGVGFFF